MKKTVLLVALVAALVIPVSAMAAGKNGGAKAGKAGKAPKSDTTTVSTPAGTPVELEGTITKAENGEVTVTIKVPTNYATKVSVDGETKTISDLKAGETVKVVFSGSSSAASIDAKSK